MQETLRKGTHLFGRYRRWCKYIKIIFLSILLKQDSCRLCGNHRICRRSVVLNTFTGQKQSETGQPHQLTTACNRSNPSVNGGVISLYRYLCVAASKSEQAFCSNSSPRLPSKPPRRSSDSLCIGLGSCFGGDWKMSKGSASAADTCGA